MSTQPSIPFFLEREKKREKKREKRKEKREEKRKERKEKRKRKEERERERRNLNFIRASITWKSLKKEVNFFFKDLFICIFIFH